MTPFRRSALFVLLSALPLAAFAQSSALPMPLESKDPAKPLEILADQTWTGDDVRPQGTEFSRLDVGSFKYDAGKGPVTLVVDYAGARPDKGADSEAIIDVGIECPEAGTPCAIPIDKCVIGIRSAYMGESVVKVDGTPEATWVGRESHDYRFDDGTVVQVQLSLGERQNLDPKAIRARLFYGDYDRAALPGQQTRGGLLLKIVAAVGVMVALFLWWMRRA
ncbi:hypothetical protein [Lysobacter tyrosinilyticus]